MQATHRIARNACRSTAIRDDDEVMATAGGGGAREGHPFRAALSRVPSVRCMRDLPAPAELPSRALSCLRLMRYRVLFTGALLLAFPDLPSRASLTSLPSRARSAVGRRDARPYGDLRPERPFSALSRAKDAEETISCCLGWQGCLRCTGVFCQLGSLGAK